MDFLVLWGCNCLGCISLFNVSYVKRTGFRSSGAPAAESALPGLVVHKLDPSTIKSSGTKTHAHTQTNIHTHTHENKTKMHSSKIRNTNACAQRRTAQKVCPYIYIYI